MKQFVIVISLFSLIISSSQAQRGWRLFNQFGWVLQIHQSANHSLWVASFNGGWRLYDGTWQQVPHASAFVFEDNAGAIWSAGPNSEGLWRYDTHGWQQQTQVTGIVNSAYQEPDGTLWVGGMNVVWRYDQSGWHQLSGFTGLVQSLHRSSDGTLWLGGADGLWRYDGNDWQPVAGITGVSTFYEDPDGTTLWVCGFGGLWRYDGNDWQPFEPPRG